MQRDGKKYVFLVGIIYPFGELNIMGIYTDEKLVLEAYNRLIKEDARCIAVKDPETPVIYKIPLDTFLGEMTDWAILVDKPYFYEKDNIEEVSIDEIKSNA